MTINTVSILGVVVSWLVFYTLHSVLASTTIKKFGENLLGSKKQYRMLYSIFSIISLLLVFCVLIVSPSHYLISRTKLTLVFSFITSTYGLIILKRSFKYISTSNFIGLTESKKNDLITKGLHSYIRHPIYSGTLLVFIGAMLFYPTDLMLASLICLVVYLPIGIFLEEEKLIKYFGDEYLEYRSKVKAIIPKVI